MRTATWHFGKRIEGSWIHADEDSSIYELKAYVQNIFTRVGVSAGALVVSESDNNIFSKALSYKNRGGKLFAEVGILNMKLLKKMGIEQPVYYAEIDLDALLKSVRNNEFEFEEICKYPAVSRDLALLLDKKASFEQVEQIAFQTEKKLLKRVELFDVYEGKNLPEGKKSYAVNFILQDANKTLNDKAIEAIMQKLIKQLTSQLGAELR